MSGQSGGSELKSTALLELAEATQARALREGADEVKVSVSRSRGVEVEWRDGSLERVQDQTTQRLSLTLYVKGRYSAHSTNDLRGEALDTFVRDAVAMTRYLEADPYRKLPDPARYAGRAALDLELADPSLAERSGETRRRDAETLESLTREAAEGLSVISVTSSISDAVGCSARVHSNGFFGAREGTHCAATVQLTLQDEEGKRPMGWDYSARRHAEDLRELSEIAQKASDRAAGMLSPKALETGRYSVVVDRRALSRLLSALISPLSGASLQQRQSLWEGRVGTQIASPLLSIYDEPHRPRSFGAALWDSDGFATHRRPLIEAGVLQTFLIDDYYARKLEQAPTGGDLHQLEWSLGNRDRAAIIASIQDGVLIDRFLGGNSNQSSGEFSFGCGGHRIRGGVIAEPVSEINISGDLERFWGQLVEVGNDPYQESASACPSCLFEGVQLSGGTKS